MFIVNIIVGVGSLLGVLNLGQKDIDLKELSLTRADALAAATLLVDYVMNPNLDLYSLRTESQKWDCNQALSCVFLEECVKGGSTEPTAMDCFLIQSESGEPRLFNSRLKTQGLNIRGEICNEFSNQSTGSECLFQPILTWSTQCGRDCQEVSFQLETKIRVSGDLVDSERDFPRKQKKIPLNF